MTAYSKTLEFTVKNTADLPTALQTYFDTYHFSQGESTNDHFVFYKKGSILDGWKLNPLNWQSTVTIELIHKNTLSVQYTVPGTNVINPLAFSELYNAFLLNLEQYLVHQNDFVEKNAEQVARAKKNISRYYGILFLGVMVSFGIGTLVQNMTGNQLTGQITSIIGALLSVKLLNKNLINRATSTKQ
ncbi:hypothetical protein MWU59_10465 [Flavobacteriaceae bacterium F08102]|nr:hypothetical protein [Flavobacteriaceae bacterium F08102]